MFYETDEPLPWTLRDRRWEKVEAQIRPGLYPGTSFFIEIRLENDVISCRIFIDPTELEHYPHAYGQTLDRLVKKMDKAMEERGYQR